MTRKAIEDWRSGATREPFDKGNDVKYLNTKDRKKRSAL